MMFYQCLCGLGNVKKVALGACMRKLLTTLNAMLKHRRPWRMAALTELTVKTVADPESLLPWTVRASSVRTLRQYSEEPGVFI